MEVNGIINRYFADLGDFKAVDYLHAYGNPRDAVLYFRLFCPETVEYKGMIFLSHKANTTEKEKEIDGVYEECGFNKEDTERRFNWEEVPYIFADRNLDDADYLILAQLISVSWGSWLKFVYPGRLFSVNVLSPDDTGSTIGVEFYTIHERVRPEKVTD